MSEALADWIGRRETAQDVVTPFPCAALAATLDREPSLPPPGTPLPPLWHWLYFLPRTRRSELGHDGHARRGGFLPPVPLPRRMWAGSRFEFNAPLRVGDAIERQSEIESITDKSGRHGALVFVTVRHEIRRSDLAGPALREWHDIVYREAASGEPTPAPADAAQPAAVWRKTWIADDVLLFRYSALTFNGHRIHYDRRYVTEAEGYPGLVVHGPLIATLLLELLRDELPDARLARFAFRARRPLFDDRPFAVCGAPQADGTLRLWAADADGATAMAASAVLADAGHPVAA